jgi:hypothetical protein
MRRHLTMDDLGDLAELCLLAVLATYRSDGTVLRSPVWHEWRDGFQVITSSRDVKVAHLRRDPRASIVVCEHSPPYRGVELRCSARSSPQESRTQSSELHLATSALRPEPHMPTAPPTTSSFASNRVICVPGTSPTNSPDGLPTRSHPRKPSTDHTFQRAQGA